MPAGPSVPGEDAERSLQDLLAVATSELEETCHLFLDEGERHGDPWLSSLFEEIADEPRGVLVFVEEEKESLLQTEG